jgi:hypothetical protein
MQIEGHVDKAMESDNLGSYLILLKDTVSEKDP